MHLTHTKKNDNNNNIETQSIDAAIKSVHKILIDLQYTLVHWIANSIIKNSSHSHVCISIFSFSIFRLFLWKTHSFISLFTRVCTAVFESSLHSKSVSCVCVCGNHTFFTILMLPPSLPSSSHFFYSIFIHSDWIHPLNSAGIQCVVIW